MNKSERVQILKIMPKILLVSSPQYIRRKTYSIDWKTSYYIITRYYIRLYCNIELIRQTTIAI